jgi:hypothetical protein
MDEPYVVSLYLHGACIDYFCVKYPTSREKLHVERVQRSSRLIGRQDPSFVQPFDVFRSVGPLCRNPFAHRYHRQTSFRVY